MKTLGITGTDGRYDNGVTNNGATSGIIAFDVPFNAPDKLSYQCSAHAAMGGTIFLTGGDTSTLVDFDAGINVTGVSTFNDNVHLLDNDKLLLGGIAGTHDGLEIYHDSSNSYITDSGSGNLLIGSDNDLWITNGAGTENKD